MRFNGDPSRRTHVNIALYGGLLHLPSDLVIVGILPECMQVRHDGERQMCQRRAEPFDLQVSLNNVDC
jgi:hypothetical protein